MILLHADRSFTLVADEAEDFDVEMTADLFFIVVWNSSLQANLFSVIGTYECFNSLNVKCVEQVSHLMTPGISPC